MYSNEEITNKKEAILNKEKQRARSAWRAPGAKRGLIVPWTMQAKTSATFWSPATLAAAKPR